MTYMRYWGLGYSLLLPMSSACADVSLGASNSTVATGGNTATGAGTSTGGTSPMGGSSMTGGSVSTGGAAGVCGDPAAKALFPACSAATDQSSCEALGGRWGTPVSGVQFPMVCNCSTGDADCPCTKGSDCSLGCYADYPTPASAGCTMTSGRCAAWPGWGCYCILGYVASDAGKFQAICVN